MKRKILLVENNEGDIENFTDRIALLQAGYEVKVERDFKTVVERINVLEKERDGRLVAAFIDLHDDRKGTAYPGYDVIEAVKKGFPHILVVALTHLGKKEAEVAERRGADAHCFKANLSELTDKWITSKLDKMAKNKRIADIDEGYFNILLAILNSLHESMRRITDKSYRHDKRDCYVIDNEYDLQDLMWTILQPIFPKIKDENPTPKHGSKSARADFYIPELKTILELKHIRKGGEASKLQSQLSEDLMLYQKNQEADILIFYVLVENNVEFDFSPIRADYNNEDHTYGEKTWKAIKFIDKKR